MKQFLLTLILPLCISNYADAKTYFVAKDGKGDFNTIQAAADVVNPGDTVIVRDGIYNMVEANRGGDENNWVVFKSEHKWGAVLDGNNNAEDIGWSFGKKGNYIRVEDFEIRNFASGGFHSNHGAKHLFIKGNHVHHIGRVCTSDRFGNDGMYVGVGSSYVTFDGNVWHDVGRLENGENGCQNTNGYYQNHDHGIYINASHIVVVNNIFYSFTRGWAIHIYGSGEKDDIKIINNTFAFPNPYRNGHITSYGTNVLVENNIFYKPTVKIFESKEGVSEKNNILDLDGSMKLMKDPEKLDFRLVEGSISIDAGIPGNAPDHDYDGKPRPKGKPVDVGAFEN